MKQFLLSLFTVCLLQGMFAQNPSAAVTIENRTGCTIYVALHQTDNTACNPGTQGSYSVPAFSNIVVQPASANHWFDWANVRDQLIPNPSCFLVTVAVPWGSYCIPSYPSVATDSPCCWVQPSMTADWNLSGSSSTNPILTVQ